MASRANLHVLLASALMCAAALLCVDAAVFGAVNSQPARPAISPNFPIVTDARLAGDGKVTRFVLDLDQTIAFRAFAIADPYRVVMDIPQVNFQLPPGTGVAGRGLIKAFRYGLVMPGGSRIVFDLSGPARIANSYMLEAANGQPPRLVLELEEVDRTAFMQALAPESRPQLRPAIADANAAAPAVQTPPVSKPAASVNSRPVVVIDPGHGGIDNGTRSGGEVKEKNLVLALAWRCVTGSRSPANTASS